MEEISGVEITVHGDLIDCAIVDGRPGVDLVSNAQTASKGSGRTCRPELHRLEELKTFHRVRPGSLSSLATRRAQTPRPGAGCVRQALSTARKISDSGQNHGVGELAQKDVTIERSGGSRGRRRLGHGNGLGENDPEALLALLPFDHRIAGFLGEALDQIFPLEPPHKRSPQRLNAEGRRGELHPVIKQPQRMLPVAQKRIVPLQYISVIHAVGIRALSPGIPARRSVCHLDRIPIVKLRGDPAAFTSPARHNPDAAHLCARTRILQ